MSFKSLFCFVVNATDFFLSVEPVKSVPQIEATIKATTKFDFVPSHISVKILYGKPNTKSGYCITTLQTCTSHFELQHTFLN